MDRVRGRRKDSASALCSRIAQSLRDSASPHPVTGDVRTVFGDLLATFLFVVAFLVLLGFHRWDLRRRGRRVAAIRESGDFGPNSSQVNSVIAAAGSIGSDAAARLVVARRAAFGWDARLDRVPKAARTARDRAFANLRDDVSRAAAEASRAAASGSLAPTALEARAKTEAAECAAETAAAIVAVDRIPAEEFRMLTRAWRDVVGPLGVAPRREP